MREDDFRLDVYSVTDTVPASDADIDLNSELDSVAVMVPESLSGMVL